MLAWLLRLLILVVMVLVAAILVATGAVGLSRRDLVGA